ncbi:MAG: preprotein translocase subunit SecE [Verrucomicrobia bacterium]|nr:preprotein translocase subunit SecE [Verrucomicrobiota bacterium]
MSLSQKQEGAGRAPAQPVKKAYEYFEEIKAEFGRISWTEGGEVLSYAKIVVGTTFVFGMLIYVTDLVIHRMLGGLDALFKLIAG